MAANSVPAWLGGPDEPAPSTPTTFPRWRYVSARNALTRKIMSTVQCMRERRGEYSDGRDELWFNGLLYGEVRALITLRIYFDDWIVPQKRVKVPEIDADALAAVAC